MVQNFNNSFFLIIFFIHFIIYGLYAYKCVFDTKDFLKEYGMHKTSAIMTRFFGSMILGSFVLAGYIVFVREKGTAGTWAFFNLIFLQNLFTFFVAMSSHQKRNLGVVKRTSVIGIIIPAILTLLSGILCFGLADKIYT
mgnify:FL=1|tara:strand:- start:2930 stop:3346 length:417 start_codon:yes stop_codon:yes gene_type:complete